MQLSLASSENPNLTEEFSIYRLNKIITEEFFNQDDENPNLDIASTIAFDRFMKKCNACINISQTRNRENWVLIY